MTPETLDGIDYDRLRTVIGEPSDPTLKGSIFNTGVAADTDFFDDALSPTNTPTTFRIYACLDTAGVLSVTRTKSEVTVTEQLNSGNNLNANASYMFDILVEEEEAINLQFDAAATILTLKVIEVSGVMS